MAQTQGVKCPYCRGKTIWRAGYAVRRNPADPKHGIRVCHLRCQSCGYTWFEDRKPSKERVAAVRAALAAAKNSCKTP